MRTLIEKRAEARLTTSADAIDIMRVLAVSTEGVVSSRCMSESLPVYLN